MIRTFGGQEDRSDAAAARRLRCAFGLHEAGAALMKQNLRRADPAASEKTIDARLTAWLRSVPPDPNDASNPATRERIV